MRGDCLGCSGVSFLRGRVEAVRDTVLARVWTQAELEAVTRRTNLS
jgi:hypothetical protein